MKNSISNFFAGCVFSVIVLTLFSYSTRNESDSNLPIYGRYAELYKLVTSLEDDFVEFDKSGKSMRPPGKRIRRGMQDLKILAQDIRKEIQIDMDGE